MMLYSTATAAGLSPILLRSSDGPDNGGDGRFGRGGSPKLVELKLHLIARAQFFKIQPFEMAAMEKEVPAVLRCDMAVTSPGLDRFDFAF